MEEIKYIDKHKHT